MNIIHIAICISVCLLYCTFSLTMPLCNHINANMTVFINKYSYNKYFIILVYNTIVFICIHISTIVLGIEQSHLYASEINETNIHFFMYAFFNSKNLQILHINYW